MPLVFGEVLDVRVVNVEVVVTDKDGERVRGLGAKDFRLKVDGQEVPIDFFSEILGGSVVARQNADDGTKEVPALAPGQPVGTSYLVFIDDFFSIARDRDRVLERLEEQAKAMQPEDRMAVVAFDGQELTMLTTWTNDERVLQSAMRQARDRPTTGLQRMAELTQNDEDRRNRRDLETTSLTFLDQEREHRLDMQLDPVEMGYATRLIDQLKRSVSAAVATLRGFADPPGRKAMILLSGGWPYNPAEYTVNDYDADFVDVVSAGADPLIPVGRQIYGDLTNAANLLGYTLYPVDLPGMQREFRDASTAAPSNEQEASIGGLFPREDQAHASLEFLARETGGEALLNSRRDVAFERVTADTRSYYWLGFTPTRSQDDQPHEIEVESLVPGTQGARARRLPRLLEAEGAQHDGRERAALRQPALDHSARAQVRESEEGRRRQDEPPARGRHPDGTGDDDPGRRQVRRRSRAADHGDGSERRPLRHAGGEDPDPRRPAAAPRPVLPLRHRPRHAAQGAPGGGGGVGSGERDGDVELGRGEAVDGT